MVGLDNPLHILILLVVLLLAFGAKRLPEMGKGIGEGMRSFKQGISGEHHEPVEPVRLVAAPEPVVPIQTTTVTAEREPATPVS